MPGVGTQRDGQNQIDTKDTDVQSTIRCFSRRGGWTQRASKRGLTHVVFPQAYSVFTVVRATWGGGGAPHVVELRAAADNATQAEDLPLAPWY